MNRISDNFAERFSHWGIALPIANLNDRIAGHIHENGWLIQYCFGSDQHGEYLDYYATHRMTDDEHVRLHSDGTIAPLDALVSHLFVSEVPSENETLEAEFHAHNRQVAKDLVAKGFNLFTINMAILGSLKDSEDSDA
jgi:hypothetical protein